MTTMAKILKGSGLAKANSAVQHLATRLERARQARNERVARADADYVEAVRNALAEIEPDTAMTENEPTTATA